MTAVPEALVLARRVREGDRSVSPYQLWKAALADLPGGTRGQVGALYRHAMVEAGFIVRPEDQRPYDPCPTCGHVFTREATG